MKKSNVLMRRFVLSVSGIFLVALMGCSSVSPSVSSTPVPLTGVFMDSAVGGINYSTPTLKGVTKADGVFQYKAGEKVTFSVGELVLGSAVGKPVITPMDIVPEVKGVADPRVVNISVLLQTLDEDGDPANGILISEKAASFVTQFGKGIVFDKPVRAFSFDAGLRGVMAELNNIDYFGATPRAVKPPVVAQKHLEATLEGLKKK